MGQETVKTLKAALSAGIALLTALWGWFGWLIVLWFCCMALDYGTGSAAALRAGTWSSRAARDGLWHKLGSVVAVLTAAILDLTVGVILKHIPGITLPFDFTVLFSPAMVIWYILTECGSVVENAGAMGAEVPPWLARAMAALRGRVDGVMTSEQAEKNKNGEGRA